MACIAVSEGGSPTEGKIYSFASVQAADTSEDIVREDPVFTSVDQLRDYYAKSDIQNFARRFCTRIVTFDELWTELQRRAVPGSVGGTQLSRKDIMSEEQIEKPKKEKKAKAEGEKAPRAKMEKITPPERIYGEDVITLIQHENPKRGKNFERYALYYTGMTVNEYKEKGGTTGDVRWDIEHGFISVDQTESLRKRAEEKAAKEAKAAAKAAEAEKAKAETAAE